MSYTVEWSTKDEAAAHSGHGVANIFIAMQGKSEALEVAARHLKQGDVVWCIKDERGNVVADRDEVAQLTGPITSGG